MKEFFNNVVANAIYLYNNHLPLILLCIIIIVILIIFFIVLSKIISKKREIKLINENKEHQSIYTQQEIDNIANNVADKSKFISSIPPENIVDDKALQESAITKSTKKTTTKKSTTKAQTNVTKTATKTTKTTNKEKAKTTAVEDKKPTQTSVKNDSKTTVIQDKKPATTTTKKTKTSKTETTKTDAPTTATTTKKAYTGKWKIKQENSKFYAELQASNGGVLLRTETYASLTGVKSGIETIKKNIDDGNFAISSDKNGRYRFKLYSKLNRLICISEDYSSRAKCDKGIESVKRFAKTAYVIIEE